MFKIVTPYVPPKSKMCLRHMIIGIILGLFCLDLSLAAGINQESDIINARIALEKMLNDPSQEKAKAFLDSLPVDVPANSRANHSVGLLRLFERNSLFFVRSAEGGNAYTAEAIFRMLNFSDGIITELLTGILGILVQKHPHLFLELLNKYKRSTYISTAGYPLLSTLKEMESAEMTLKEWESRMEALGTVMDRQLIQLRDECIDLIQSKLTGIQIIVNQHQEYRQLLDFLKVIKPIYPPPALFEVNCIPKWDVMRVMQIISKNGTIFDDQRDGTSAQLSYKEIESELILRKGKAFELLGQLGHLYYFSGDWALAFKDIGNEVILSLDTFFSLVFVKSDGHFSLVACTRFKDYMQ